MQSRRIAFAVAALALLVLVVIASVPPVTLFARRDDLLTVHLLVEAVAVVISLMVVSVAWHSLQADAEDSGRALILGFTVVAGADLLHAMAYPGMPALVTPGNSGKAIFFWLAARSAEVLTYARLAMFPPVHLTRRAALGWGVGIVVALFFFGTWHLGWFPQTFRPGSGVTAFKSGFEIVLSVCYFALALYLYRRGRREERLRWLWLATACFVMGCGELLFSRYVSDSDLQVLAGHGFKLVAFAFVYRAVVIAALQEPLRQLERSGQTIRDQQAELETLLRNLPLGISRIDRERRFRYLNPSRARLLGADPDQVIGHRVDEVLGAETLAVVEPHLARALAGESARFEAGYPRADGAVLNLSVVLVPEPGSDGGVEGVLCIFSDDSERHEAQSALLGTLRELSDLKAALDAHAIVAVTDARGVIQRVNDKFCAISKYARDELVGQTHRLINSGTHPRAFFVDMWRTIASGRVWNGEVCNRAKDGSLYWVHTTIVPFIGGNGLPEQYIAIRADITARKQAEEAALRLAFHDPLTGLGNRRMMQDRLRRGLAQSRAHRRYGALILIDLDEFRAVNDTLGHEAGDALLREVARRLGECAREADTVIRLGGDEFVLVLEDLGERLDTATTRVAEISELVRRVLDQPYVIDSIRVDAPPSAGVVMLDGGIGQEEDALKQAELALYKAKSAGGNQVVFFDPALQQDVNERAGLLADLRDALELGQLRLHLQPIVAGDRRVLGHEVLLRWSHPQRGLVSPASFIPLAEQSGLILPIGQWILESTCTLLAAWAADPVKSQWTLAVNVSARQFHDPGFGDSVLLALHRSGADPRRLRLELTESMLHTDLAETAARMERLQREGVRFSLDDFGTGYSSLAYLQRLPLDVLKIDQSFVREITTRASDAVIAETIVSLGKSLRLRVIAEGVETEAQFEFLRGLGCDGFQGWLTGRPVPAEE
ncbi:bifunctional diguanylate cyclase/phosphodiesterase [Arenimonas composti]|uniref:cyclic-guanylate-specific phosphodiesterase n=1 Tax=Arenimonas composti TR7-09 = DSM 18010 TaxID=1121013 RepID=A0A091BID7_9GAMM|nr:EAL domain-containing protein [Arenimonas composti]KFN51516.1 hypothetical protein P873_00215 [Arenimonas composti TR7-09 = DSM 18010]